MVHFIFWLAMLLAWPVMAQSQTREVKLKIVETSDVHGNFYPYDFIRRQPAEGSLARVQTFVKQQRETYGDNLLLLDNGDILQGQPAAYYYNYMDTLAPHLTAEMLNFMGYDAGNMGNHDVETGRAVFDRWIGDCHFPVLGANIIETATGKTHCKPYVVLERDGVKLVVLGMITPAIPMWLSESLWPGLRFEDMEETARKWLPLIREREQPDVVVGLFHAGKEGVTMGGKYRDNASVEVAQRVPGFDVVLIGHDHARACSFLIADGVLPSNEGRGYVLRRILRRAARFGIVLDMNDPFIYKLFPYVKAAMADAYPILIEEEENIVRAIKMEEERFHLTLKAGMNIVHDIIARMRAAGETVFCGSDLFMLYDTYGFPLDLAKDIAEEEGFPAIAKMYREIAVAEKGHEERYLAFVKNIEDDKVFKKDVEVVWQCRNCGYIYVGTEAPETCPACLHPQAYFEVKKNNY